MLYMHVVYILYSKSTSRYYCGETANMVDRLDRHNHGRSKSTAYGVPWEVITTISCENRAEARKLEKKIKARGISRWLND